jgi:hypothetical protein
MATQVADTNAAIRDNRERTEALAARTEEIAQRSPPPTAPSSSAPGLVYTVSLPPAPPTPQIRVDVERGSSSRPPSPRQTETGSGPDGHRDARLHRGDAPGILGNPLPSPCTGTYTGPPPSDPRVGVRFEEFRGGTPPDNTRTPNPTPKMDFPKFDGENPKLWKTQCENYFEVFRVQPCLCTHFASLNFISEATLWLQNHEAKLGRVEHWDEMCTLVLNQFGRNKYSLYRRQLRQLRQLGSALSTTQNSSTLDITCCSTTLH